MPTPPVPHTRRPSPHPRPSPAADHPDPARDETTDPAPVGGRSGWTRARSTALVALLCAALGVGIVTQVRRTGTGDALDSARPADLVVLLDSLQQREATLREEVTALQGTVRDLTSDGEGSSAALTEARDRAHALAILVGTAAARGPGLILQISDPDGGVGPDVVLDTVQELRAAGAEAVQIGGAGAAPVRIGLDSAFTGTAGGVLVDGRQLSAPLVLTVIGDPPTLAAALDIPGGVVDAVARAGGAVRVTQRGDVEVTALRVPREPQYARPSS